MKSYTDIEQSKALSKILPNNSADMYYDYDIQKHEYYPMFMDDQFDDTCICAWSLTALLKILSNIASKIDDDGSVNLSSFKKQWSVNMFDCPVEVTDNYSNPIDACYEMILKLHKLDLL